MGIAERIPEAMEAAPPAKVVEARVGRKYTAVTLQDGAVGVALTQLPEPLGCCGEHDLAPQAGGEAARVLAEANERLAGLRWSRDVVALLASDNSVERAAGLACANALANRTTVPMLPGDLLQHLRVRPEDVVGMVGFFGPLVGPLQAKSARLHVFERKDGDGSLLPAEAAFDLLPRCDIAVITSGTITNGTIDRLLQAAGSCREVAMVGASTPLLAAVFRDSPVTWLSGSVVTEGELTVKVISEGGGRKEFNSYLRKGNIPCMRRVEPVP
ncbi:MAG: DUF364 domain-containing protein [Gaiellales bacterium]|nr:DUF364 domain-containing protein [Gaiellales bacterium]